MLQTLEQRRLMAIDLAIEGTLNADLIELKEQNGQLVYTVNGQTSTHALVDINSIKIDAKAGADKINAAALLSKPVSVEGGSGNDTIFGTPKNDTLSGGDFQDSISGFGGNDGIWGGAGSDVLDGGTGNDTVYGGLGNETLIGGEGDDQLHGEQGADKIWGSFGHDSVYAGPGNDTVQGDSGNDRLNGEDGNDSLDGNAGDDSFYGGKGNDVINPHKGKDRISGGEDVDSVQYKERSRDLKITLDNTANDGEAGEGDNVLSDVEDIWGGSGHDLITGNDSNNRLFGEKGNDTLNGANGNDSLYGWYGTDELRGGNGVDKAYGEWDPDIIFGDDGTTNYADELHGQHGDDTLVAVGDGKDSAYGGDGTDYFWVDSADVVDATNAESNGRFVNRITSFRDGAAIEPDGQNLTDPSLGSLSSKAKYGKTFASTPLFRNNFSLNYTDIKQGSLGDCYFLAGLASVAQQKPSLIKQSVTSLGDGTYAVRYYDEVGGGAKYYRVDGSLPVRKDDANSLAFAQIQNNCQWPAIMEKAWAMHRTSDNSYEAIEGDDDLFDPGTGDEVFMAMNYDTTTRWVIAHSEESNMGKMRSVLKNGGFVTASTDPPALGCDLVPLHVYTVLNVSDDLNWITLYNPWAKDDKGFAHGGNDGVIRISTTQFDDDFFFIYYS